MGERLVYTQEVAGSSPAPPTLSAVVEEVLSAAGSVRSGLRPGEIAAIAEKLRKDGGLGKEPTGLVADLEKRTRRTRKRTKTKSK